MMSAKYWPFCLSLNMLKGFSPQNMNMYQWISHHKYHQVSDISRTLAGYKIVDHSDVVGASPVGAAPTTSSFST